METSPAAFPGTGLSHTPGDGCSRAANPHLCLTGLPAQPWEGAADVAGVKVALGGDTVLHHPSTSLAAFPEARMGSSKRPPHTGQVIYLEGGN